MALMVGPQNRREQAAENRANAEHHLERARSAEARGSDSSFRRAEADRSFAKAYAWETGVGALEVLGAEVERAFALRAAGLI